MSIITPTNYTVWKSPNDIMHAEDEKQRGGSHRKTYCNMVISVWDHIADYAKYQDEIRTGSIECEMCVWVIGHRVERPRKNRDDHP